MWESIMEEIIGRIPKAVVIICAVLSSLIPWCVYRINQSLHRYGDPPWKKK